MFTLKINALVFAALMPVSLLGCERVDSEEETPASGPDLVGTWRIDCRADGTAVIRTLVFTDTSVTRTSVAHEGLSNCEESARLAETTLIGTYSRPATGPRESGAYPIKEVYTDITLTILSESMAADYNSRARCGYSDWEVGVPKPVKERSGCEEGAALMLFNIPLTSYYVVTDGTRLEFVDSGDNHVKGVAYTRQ